jgi:hypothetical protein
MQQQKNGEGVYFADVYGRLAAPFDHTFTDNRGGVQLEYITGEQCISRLNEVLGVAGWSFVVREHGINAEADECWALGEITANFGGTIVVRQQFGSQKVKRSRASGNPLDIGFDLKGAGTDALKKCASLLGVGLYLSKKEEQSSKAGNGSAAPAERKGQLLPPLPRDSQPAAQGPTFKAPQSGSIAEQVAAADVRSGTRESLACADCGKQLTETRFKDGTVWSPADLAGYGTRKHNRALCMDDYRKANAARQRQESPDAF